MTTNLACAIGALAIVLFPLLARAQFTLTPIVTKTTPIPGGVGTFRAITAQDGSDPIAPSLDGTSMVFTAIDANIRSGIYRWDNGVFSKVADTSTPIPGRGQNFSLIGFGAISGPNVFFRGSGSTVDGLFLANGSQILAYATTSPGPGSYARPSVADGEVAFGSGSAIYASRNGNVVQLGAFQSAGNAHIGRGGYVAFEANTSNSLRGVYLADTNNVISTIADSNTPVPGGTGNFTGFGCCWVSDDGPDVAFSGFASSTSGIYARIGGVLRPVVVDGQAAPLGQTFFIGSFPPEISLDNQHTAFLAVAGFSQDSARGAIFTDYRNRIERVIGDGDLLGGKVVERLEMSPDALSGSNLVFTVRFTDASTAIYMARVPEPASLAAVLPLLLLLRRRRRCHRFI